MERMPRTNDGENIALEIRIHESRSSEECPSPGRFQMLKDGYQIWKWIWNRTNDFMNQMQWESHNQHLSRQANLQL